jgi:hypothetical protein
VTPEPWSGPDYNALLASAERQLAAAKDRVDGAVKRFKDASRHAAGGVNDANHDDLKNDTSLWGSIKRGAHWLAEHVPLEAIAGILSKVSAVFGIIALIPIPIVQEIAAAIALGAAGLTLLADLVIQTNKSYEGTFTWGDFALTIGIDSVAFVASAGAFRAGSAARAATASSRVAVAEATAAREAAAGATAARETVDAAVAARAARLRQLTGGPIRSFVNGLLGRTGRAETQLANAERSLSAASRAEQQALAVSAAKSSAATAAETTASAAEHTSHVWEGADKSAAASGVANVVAHEHVHTWNPVTAITRSTQQEISELQHWGRRDGLPEIPAQPIP